MNYNFEDYDEKIYLNVPFNEKDEAKKYGCKWDVNEKKWYILDNNNNKNKILFKWGNVVKDEKKIINKNDYHKDDTICNICYEIFENKIILKCGHTLCLICCLKIVKNDCILNCPFCK